MSGKQSRLVAYCLLLVVILFYRKDLIFSLFTGFYTGLIFWRVLVFLKAPSLGLPTPVLWVAIIPALWVLGVNLGYFLGRWLGFFNQFGKYAAVGFTNFFVDTGVVNFLIASSGIAAGFWFSIFKTISFIIAVSHSYFWNRAWVFESQEQNRRQEFFKFMAVNLIAAAVNVGTASFVVNGLDPAFGLDPKTWANVGVVAGSAVALVFSFIGFRLIVFKQNLGNYTF